MELVLFYIAGTVSVVATTLVVTRANASHALIYLIVSLLAVAVIFFLLGAPFAAALEIVIYAGAIMVLFLFVVMMLNLGRTGERAWMAPRNWLGPGALCLILLFEMSYLILVDPAPAGAGSGGLTLGRAVGPKAVGLNLFGPYIIAVELASVLLLAALVGAYHLGRRYLRARPSEERR